MFGGTDECRSGSGSEPGIGARATAMALLRMFATHDEQRDGPWKDKMVVVLLYRRSEEIEEDKTACARGWSPWSSPNPADTGDRVRSVSPSDRRRPTTDP